MSNKTGIYIHIPFCKRKCNYCAFVSVCDFSYMRDYVQALIREIRDRGNKEEVDSVYIGGGTPSVLYKGALKEIFGAIYASFTVLDDCEITVEGNPESISQEFATECKECGINRFSIGLQSSDAQFLEKAGRLHNVKMFENAVSVVRKTVTNNISADLIYGFEGQSVENAVKDAEYLANVGVKHISTYALTVEEGTEFCKRGIKTDADYQAEQYYAVCDKLKSYGYERYEVSNFAQKGYESRHNSKYWEHAPYLGFGLSAHSFVFNKRRANTDDLKEYLRGEIISDEYIVNKDDLAQEKIMLSLRMDKGLDLNAFEMEFGRNLQREKEREINELLKLDLITIQNGVLKVTNKGFFLLDSIILKLI